MTDKPQENPSSNNSTENGGGWGSWGWSVLSNTVSTVQSTISTVNDSYVKPTLGTVTNATSQMVNDLAKAIDVEENPNAEKQEQSDPKEEKVDTPNQDSSAQQASEGPLFSLIDSTINSGVSLITNSADYITDIVHKGVESVQSGAALEQGKKVLSKVPGRELVNKGFQVGTDIAHQSFGALEKVGATAFSLLTEEVSPNNKNLRGRRMTVDDEDNQGQKKEERSFAQAFELQNGPSHLQALENLSIECMMKTQQHYKKLKSEQKEIVDEESVKLQAIFDEDKQEETEEIGVPDLPSKDVLDIKQKEVAEIENLLNEFKKELETLSNNVSGEAKPNTEGGEEKKQSSEEPQTTTDKTNAIFEFVVNYYSKMEDKCLHSLAKLCASSVEQLLRISEKCLADAETNNFEANTFFQQAKNYSQTADYFNQELTLLSTQFIDALQQITKKKPKMQY